jgi:serine/threonine protein kinase
LKTFCGTPFYFAPEVLRRQNTVLGMGRYGTAADLWSLGVILYILLSGSFPFDEAKLFDQIQYAQYSLSGPEWHSISESAKHLIRSLMTLRPEHRINVDQALKHPWITQLAPPSSMKLPAAKKNQPSIQSYLNPQPHAQLSKLESVSKSKPPENLKPKETAPAASTGASTPHEAASAPDRIPIGNIFWSIRSSKDASEMKAESSSHITGMKQSTGVAEQQPKPVSALSLFNQVMSVAHHLPADVSSPANIPSTSMSPPPAVGSRRVHNQTSVIETGQKYPKPGNETKSSRKPAVKRKIKTIQQGDGGIVVRYSSGNNSEDEYRELPNDKIESFSSDEYEIAAARPSLSAFAAIQQAGKKARRSTITSHQKITKNAPMHDAKPAYSLEKAWKLDQLPSATKPSSSSPEKCNKRDEVERSEHDALMSPTGNSEGMVKVSTPASDFKPGLLNSNSKSLSKQLSKRKLRQPVKTMADIFKRKSKQLQK